MIELNPKKYPCNLCDSANRKDLKWSKALDISENCKPSKGEKAILLYTRSVRGRICQLSTGDGMSIHFFVDELARELEVEERNDTFGLWASRWCLSKPKLMFLIQFNAPF